MYFKWIQCYLHAMKYTTVQNFEKLVLVLVQLHKYIGFYVQHMYFYSIFDMEGMYNRPWIIGNIVIHAIV